MKMSRELLFKGYTSEKRVAFTGLMMHQIIAEYSREEIQSMSIFEWTNVMDWRGINIYRGDKVQMFSKGEKTLMGYVEYEPQLCRYIVKGEKAYDDLNHSAMTGSSEGVTLDGIEITGNCITTPLIPAGLAIDKHLNEKG